MSLAGIEVDMALERQAKLEDVRAAIVKVVPERSGYEYGTEYCGVHDWGTHSSIVVDCPKCKPGTDTIRLSDVLRAIGKTDALISVRDDGRFMVGPKQLPAFNSTMQTFCDWNLADDDLDHQSQGTTVFLWGILCV